MPLVGVLQFQLHVALPGRKVDFANRNIGGCARFCPAGDGQCAAGRLFHRRKMQEKASVARCADAFGENQPIRRRHTPGDRLPIRRRTPDAHFLAAAQHRAIAKQGRKFEFNRH